jgi:3'-phosphoadenosine 5'-phosphosulfate (PAPS) 3'-phosphatase
MQQLGCCTIRLGCLLFDYRIEGLNYISSAAPVFMCLQGKNDLQTEADRSAQRCIVTSLSRQFPSVTIIGEEGPSDCEVPSDWVVTDSDPQILQLTCPKELLDLKDSEVCGLVWTL